MKVKKTAAVRKPAIPAKNRTSPKTRVAAKISGKPAAKKKSPKAKSVVLAKPKARVKSLKARPAQRRTVKRKAAVKRVRPRRIVIRTAVHAPREKIITVKLAATAEPRSSKRPRVSPVTAGSPWVGRAKTSVVLPEILFEGDHPGTPVTGEHFATGGHLPDAYGTRQIVLTARDPHWLYAHWDLTREQLRHYNAQSAHKHLVLRVHPDAAAAEPVNEVHVHPESRHWFVHVAEGGAKYVVALGYYDKQKAWTTISTSTPTATPPEAVSNITGTQFATIPMEIALSRLVEIVKTGAGESLPLAHAIEELRLAGHPELPPLPEPAAAASWTPEQERALAGVVQVSRIGRLSVGSLDITELVRHGLQQEFSSITAALGGPGGISSLSSPAGGAAPPRGGFWMNVNAELIIYGATEPGAGVSIGGHEIKLRADGSFSYRFALPDGEYELPVTAVAADGTEARHADLRFSRATDYVGDAGRHPQDPALKPPLPENT